MKQECYLCIHMDCLVWPILWLGLSTIQRFGQIVLIRKKKLSYLVQDCKVRSWFSFWEYWSNWPLSSSSRQVHCRLGCPGCYAEACCGYAPSPHAWWGKHVMFWATLALSLWFVKESSMFLSHFLILQKSISEPWILFFVNHASSLAS
jgi:hypothetical protein